MATKLTFDSKKFAEDIRRKISRSHITLKRNAMRIGIPATTLTSYLNKPEFFETSKVSTIMPILYWLGTKFEDYMIIAEGENGDQ